MPELQQTTGEDAAEASGLDAHRQALRALSAAYERTVADMAAAVCAAEGTIDGTGEFVLTEIENRYVHRIRDLQTLIGSLRNHLYGGRPASPSVDELRTPQAELPARLARWLADHPGADLLHLLVERTGEDEDELQVVPIYYPGP